MLICTPMVSLVFALLVLTHLPTTRGAKDDWPALQHALETLSESGGGTPTLEARLYTLSQPLRIAGMSGIQIVGAGSSALNTFKGTVLSGSNGLLSFESSAHCGASGLLLANSSSAFAISVDASFWITLSNLRLERVLGGLLVNASNTVTFSDSLLMDVQGPTGIEVGAQIGARVDIFQGQRVTTNNNEGIGSNTSCIWLHIGQGVNTVRLDNFGLINGGNGVRMDMDFPASHTAAHSPSAAPNAMAQLPLFLLANDLEIDFPKSNAVHLEVGRVANCVNCYIQGSKEGHGIYVSPKWAAEIQISNSRISGHAFAGMSIKGGRHITITGNIIADNSQAGLGQSSGLEIGGTAQQVVVTGNRIGAVQSDLPPVDTEKLSSPVVCGQQYGVYVHEKAAAVIVSSNLLGGNTAGGVLDDTKKAMIANNFAEPVSMTLSDGYAIGV